MRRKQQRKQAVAASKSKSNLTTHHLYDKKPGGCDASGFFCLFLYMKSFLANTVSFYFSFVLFICLLVPGGCFQIFFSSCHFHFFLPFPFFLFPQAVFIYFINAFTVNKLIFPYATSSIFHHGFPIII